MVHKLGFSIRGSGRYQGKCYIDLAGSYAIGEIAEATGLSKEVVEDVYIKRQAMYEEAVGVYYFPEREAALTAIADLEGMVAGGGVGKMVFLTYEELDYIRQALINEGSNVISVRNETKRRIFDKFNR